MKFFKQIKAFFTPSPDLVWWKILAPYALLVAFFLVLSVGGAYGWEYTNSPQFCGESCHTMPPEYDTYLNSPHAEVKCVECHIGRAFIGNQITRKMGDFRHVTAMLFTNYEYPIRIKSLRPAEEVCEQCHSVDKFSEATMLEIAHFANDVNNSKTITYLTMKTGGGKADQGLGKGIHWHIQNDVRFYATDDLQQDIVYIKSTDLDSGITKEFLDINSDLDPYSIDEADLVDMDCSTCHNRISHEVRNPEESVDIAMDRNLISPMIPEIRAKAVEILLMEFDSAEKARNNIGTLSLYYQETYPEFFETDPVLIFAAIDQLKIIYSESVFLDQKVDWNTHPDNLGHKDSPGCFRCHDGEHYDISGRVIPVECNMCHSIPVVVDVSLVEEVSVPVLTREQPKTHGTSNWLILHGIAFDEERDAEDEICTTCHDVTAYDTADNVSFCSNVACHGSVAEQLDFIVEEDINSELFRTLLLQLPHYPAEFEPIEEWIQLSTPEEERFYLMDTIHANAEYEDPDDPEHTEILCEDCHGIYPPQYAPTRQACIACHGETEAGWAELTAGFEPSPHDGHDGYLACVTCHKNFGPYEDPCALCHTAEPYTPIDEEASN